MATSKVVEHPTARDAAPNPMRAEEMALVGRCRAGDLAAFEELYRAHAGKLFSVACRLVGNPADAEDLLQESSCRHTGSSMGSAANRRSERGSIGWRRIIASTIFAVAPRERIS